MRKLLLPLLLASVGFSAPYHYKNNHQNYIDDYETGFKKYRVVSSTPITKEITKRVRVGDEIRDKVVSHKVPCGGKREYRETNTIGLDTIIGTVAGVALGNQFKNHKDAARVIGGLGGGYIANQMRNTGSSDTCYEQTTVQEYIPRYETVTENITVGYKNCVRVDGEKICKESDRKRKYLKVKSTYTVY
jgi:uncharacterized protein YcfJ